MGLLDSSDEEVKNHAKYKNVNTAIKGMEDAMGRYKEGGGGDQQATSLAMAVERVFKKVQEGKDQFPSYAGWDDMTKDATEIGKALQGKHPEDRYVKNFGTYIK